MVATPLIAAPPAPAHHAFVVYDNIFYPNKPDTAPYGMLPINIIYEKAIWPNGASETVLPVRTDFDALVAKATRPGPVVLDVELLGLTSAENERVLATLVDWVHQDMPGKPVGYYGTNTLTKVKPENMAYAKDLAAHVDAMFPPMYTYNPDQAAWAARAKMEVDEAHILAPGKPVYFYLQPQYHHTTPLKYQYVDAEYWAFQLQTSRQLTDGVVIWTGTRWPWDDAAGWWQSTQAFLKTLQAKGK
ncbi:MAG: hypothetical protein P4L10_06805 [Acidobacteriaceae bacterium]|nr:hypothetical protein [Acidobacteriaceae bacterium]